MRNAQVAEQSGLILPQVLDENGNKFFDFEIVSVTGQKAYDTNSIIARYSQEILTCLFADFLSLGNNGSGSFSLAESKVSVVEMAIESKLMEIQDQLNHDLIPQLFALNGWDASVTPLFQFGKIAKQDLDVLSKYVQRLGAVGLISQDAKTVNWLASEAGMPIPFDDQDTDIEDVRVNLTGYTSGAGEGMTEGMSNGTGGSNGSSGDSSVSNTENKSVFKSLDEEFEVVTINGKKFTFMKEDAEEFK